MRKNIISILFLAIISLFTVSCANSNTTVDNKNCANSCDKTWQQCNNNTQKCEPKEGFCTNDDACKSDETKPKCNTETHLCVTDKCSNTPCKDNTEKGNTLCKLDSSTEGFSCICEEGFELKEDKCVEKTINPCNTEPCKDNTDGKTVCKVDDTATDGYTCENPIVLDPCENMPCKDNTDGKTVCKVDDTVTDGYTCESPIVLDPCENMPCKDNTDGKTKCEQAENTDGYICSCKAGFEFNDTSNKCEAIQCNNTCENIGETKCTGDRLIKCVKDDITYCTVWQETTDATDCGAGLCVDNNDGGAYCKCQECDPDSFNSVCSDDLNSFDYCDNTDGCFTIKTINCEAGKHCGDPDANGNLSCVNTTCSDECSEGSGKCETASEASFLVECKKANNGCYYWDNNNRINCTINGMTCSQYNNTNICLGGEGNNTCQDNSPNNNEILISGIWIGNTENQDNSYQGCGTNNNNFNGRDAVYTINVEQGANLNISLKKLKDNNSSVKVNAYLYVLKGDCSNNDYCELAESNNPNKASLSLTNLDAGKYNIIIDSDKATLIMLSSDSYKYELTVDLQ